LNFRPLQRSLRGTFDLNRIMEPTARMKVTEFPRPIPGLHIVVDEVKRTAEVRDPLHDAGYRVIREQIEAKGFRLGVAAEHFELDASAVNTWLFWMRRAVASGTCKIVDGSFGPIDEAAARKDFLNAPQVDPRDALIERLLTTLGEHRKGVASTKV